MIEHLMNARTFRGLLNISMQWTLGHHAIFKWSLFELMNSVTNLRSFLELGESVGIVFHLAFQSLSAC